MRVFKCGSSIPTPPALVEYTWAQLQCDCTIPEGVYQLKDRSYEKARLILVRSTNGRTQTLLYVDRGQPDNLWCANPTIWEASVFYHCPDEYVDFNLGKV